MNRVGIKKTVEDYISLPYTVTLKRDDEGDVIARIQEFQGCTAHGESESEAIENLRLMQHAWISARIDAGLDVPVPDMEEELPSGKFLQRVPRSLHRRLIGLAKKEGVSLNTLVTTMLSDASSTKAVQDDLCAAFVVKLKSSASTLQSGGGTAILRASWPEADVVDVWGNPPATSEGGYFSATSNLSGRLKQIMPKVVPDQGRWENDAPEKTERRFAH